MDPDPYQNATDPEHCYDAINSSATVRSKSEQVEVGTRFGKQEN